MSDWEPKEILEGIKNSKLAVRVRLRSQPFQIGTLMDLTPGSILRFDKKNSDGPALVVNGSAIAEGQVVQVEENYGFEVTEIQKSSI